jgi:hypothetical protein
LWLIFFVLFAASVALTSFTEIRRDFKAASGLAKSQVRGIRVPMSCTNARGTENRDYVAEVNDAFCWYDMPSLRKIYPEYDDVSDRTLIDAIYMKMREHPQWPTPWLK